MMARPQVSTLADAPRLASLPSSAAPAAKATASSFPRAGAAGPRALADALGVAIGVDVVELPDPAHGQPRLQVMCKPPPRTFEKRSQQPASWMASLPRAPASWVLRRDSRPSARGRCQRSSCRGFGEPTTAALGAGAAACFASSSTSASVCCSSASLSRSLPCRAARGSSARSASAERARCDELIDVALAPQIHGRYLTHRARDVDPQLGRVTPPWPRRAAPGLSLDGRQPSS
jgi:hypothetical protein